MDSCVVHVPDDFDPDILRVVRSLVRETGGTLVNEMDGFVTHCIAQNVKLSQT